MYNSEVLYNNKSAGLIASNAALIMAHVSYYASCIPSIDAEAGEAVDMEENAKVHGLAVWS